MKGTVNTRSAGSCLHIFGYTTSNARQLDEEEVYRAVSGYLSAYRGR